MKNLSMIVAVSQNGVIGRNGKLPWHLPADLQRFKQLTSGSVVICGRATHESIVTALGSPLPGRETIVISRQFKDDEYSKEHSVWWEQSPLSALEVVAKDILIESEVFVIGGAQIYQALLPEVSKIYATVVHAALQGDTSMPRGWLSGFRKTTESSEWNDGTYPYHFALWQRA